MLGLLICPCIFHNKCKPHFSSSIIWKRIFFHKTQLNIFQLNVFQQTEFSPLIRASRKRCAFNLWYASRQMGVYQVRRFRTSEKSDNKPGDWNVCPDTFSKAAKRKENNLLFFNVLPSLHNSEGFEFPEFKKCLDNPLRHMVWLFVGPVQGQELDWIILVAPFQLRLFYHSTSISAVPAWGMSQWGAVFWDHCCTLLVLGSQPWGWLVPQGRAGSAAEILWSKQWATGRLGQQWALWAAACEAWDLGQKGVNKYTGASVQPGGPNHHAEGRREMATWDHILFYFLCQIMNFCLIPVGVQAPGVLVLQPGQFAKTQPKGLPAWMSVTIQPWRNFLPRKLQNLPGKADK